VPTVARFNVTPLKSSSLHHPDEIELGVRGVPGDRRFLILHADGRRLSGAEKAPFLGIRADHEAGRLSLRFPDGAALEAEAVTDGDAYAVALYDREVLVHDVSGPFSQALSRTPASRSVSPASRSRSTPVDAGVSRCSRSPPCATSAGAAASRTRPTRAASA
jgi:uncharacterized protein YcbX